jgi:hypothetical protein
LRIRHPLIAYWLDEAVVSFGNNVERKLAEITGRGKNPTPKYTFEQALGVGGAFGSFGAFDTFTPPDE